MNPITRINPAELSPPHGFSHAVTATGGRLVFLAGQTALDGDGKVVGATLPEQFETALGNLLTALRAAAWRPDLAGQGDGLHHRRGRLPRPRP